MRARIGLAAAAAAPEEVRIQAVNDAYIGAVRSAGALPLLVPVLDPGDAPAVLGELDGLVLAGGGDVDPALYGAVAGPATYGVDAWRDRWELALIDAAAALGLPVLGVCRGLQILNVAAGGTLVAHLPDVTDRPHRAPERPAEPVHSVDVVSRSVLVGLTGPTCGANSLHHQAADRTGAGLRVVGRAPDGTVEALEGTEGSRVLAVQWHPELLLHDAAHAGLFEWLVGSAARRRSAVRGSPPPRRHDLGTWDLASVTAVRDESELVA